MKQQTSLEFLIIAGAIGILVLSSIMQYGWIVRQYKNLPASTSNNYSVPADPTYYQKPLIKASIPALSLPDNQNELSLSAFGCSNGTIFAYINSATATFSTYNLTQNFYNVWTYEDSFVPSPGLNNVRLNYVLDCNGSKYNGTDELSTVSPQANLQTTYSAYISGRNETIDYAVQKQQVFSLVGSAHCTYENFFYTPYPIQFQCGSISAWQYRILSSICSSNGGSPTETVCVVPGPSGYNISTSQHPSGYDYQANLTIMGPYQLRSRISSSNKENPVYFDGQVIGNLSVENVSYEQANQQSVLMSGQRTGYINYTYLRGYEQARNNLFSLLAYYNSSFVSSDIASQIQQEVAAYDFYESQLTSAASNSTPAHCYIQNGSMECPAQYPFYYMVNATISPRYVYQNQTISYEGSVIRVLT